MNSNIIKTQKLHKVGDFYVMERFCDFFPFRPSNLIKTLTSILRDNSCPCLKGNHRNDCNKENFKTKKHKQSEINQLGYNNRLFPN